MTPTTRHFTTSDGIQLAWINTEGLPDYRTGKHQKLVEKWMATTGRMPG